MTRDEMERWQKLRVACLEIVQGARTLPVHADDIAGPERALLRRIWSIVPDAEALARECQERLGMRTARAAPPEPPYLKSDQDWLPVPLAVFVFGSNLAGRHGKGAALEARQRWGAEYGVGRGRTGNAYAIPTKDHELRPLPLESIRTYVREFVAYAREHPALRFYVTRVGCGLAGYSEAQIRPMFEGAPENCEFTWEGAAKE